MAKNERLQQIISNIQILNELTSGMEDSEIYPVSFFSKAFDLIQKIQSDFHLLEAEQVKLFETQMKKHQALILSIHQQMQTIEGGAAAAPHAPAAKPVSKPETPKSADTAPKKIKAVERETNEPKKVSFFSRLTHKDKNKTENPEKEENTAEITAKPIAKKTESPEKPVAIRKASIIESPIVIPKKAEKPVSEQAKEIEKEQIASKKAAAAATKKESGQAEAGNNVSKSETAAKETADKAKATVKDVIKSKTPESEQSGMPAEGSAPPSVNDAIEKKKLSDLRKAFSLNDRFRYRRELFAGDEDAMNKAIAAINHKESYEESMKYLEEKLHWNFSDPTVKDFIKILKMRFL